MSETVVDDDLQCRWAFVIGAPRSGTTWLNRLLGAHPRVASLFETRLFDHYGPAIDATIADLADRQEWLERIARDPSASMPMPGMSLVLDRDDLYAALRDPLRRIERRVGERRPDVEVIVEKTPRHGRVIGRIEQVVPDARYIHIIRDGRDVARSLNSAARGWGQYWAARDPVAAARTWRDGVEAAMQGRALGDRYLEVRYEDLRADPQEALRPVWGHLGLEDPGPISVGDQPTEFVSPELHQRLGGLPAMPPGFRRRPGDPELGTVGRLMVDAVAGDLLEELGYGSGSGTVGRASRSAFRTARRITSPGMRRRVAHALRRITP